jgi:hypothetical protein
MSKLMLDRWKKRRPRLMTMKLRDLTKSVVELMALS